MSPATQIHMKADPFRGEVLDYIFELASVGSRVLPAIDDGKLVTVLNMLQTEWRRRDSGLPATQEGFTKFHICELMSTLLMHRVVAFRSAKIKAGVRATAQERRLTYTLSQVALDFLDIMDEYTAAFGDVCIPVDLAEKLWFAFHGVTSDECRSDAAEIRAQHEAAHAAR